MLVQGKVIEPHWTPEGDVGLLTVEDLIPVDNEEAGKLGEHCQHVDPLEEVDVDVGHPELVDELDVHRHVGIVRIRRRSLYTGLKPPTSLILILRREHKSHHTPDPKVHGEGHSELDIVHLEDLEDVEVHADLDRGGGHV